MFAWTILASLKENEKKDVTIYVDYNVSMPIFESAFAPWWRQPIVERNSNVEVKAWYKTWTLEEKNDMMKFLEKKEWNHSFFLRICFKIVYFSQSITNTPFQIVLFKFKAY